MDKDLKSIVKYYDKKYSTQLDEKFKFITYPTIEADMYVISNYGLVFNTITEHKMTPIKDRDGYLRVQLRTNRTDLKRKYINIGVHRLVAYAFCENKNPNDYSVVNHLNGNKEGNYYKNLEWTTSVENTRHAIRTGLQINSGPNCPSAVYSEDMIRKICKLMENGFDNSYIYFYFKPDDDHIEDRAFYALIFSIRNKKRHVIISNEYNIPLNNSTSKPKFSKDDELQIQEFINKGWSTIQIAKYYGAHSVHDCIGKRICDKVRYMKSKNN